MTTLNSNITTLAELLYIQWEGRDITYQALKEAASDTSLSTEEQQANKLALYWVKQDIGLGSV